MFSSLISDKFSKGQLLLQVENRPKQSSPMFLLKALKADLFMYPIFLLGVIKITPSVK